MAAGDVEAATGSTAPPGTGERAGRHGYRWRLAFAAVLVVAMALGLLGTFDPRQATVEAIGGGFVLRVEHPARTRPGLSASWSVEVRSADGRPLPAELTVATTSAYFELYDEHGLDPEPVESSADGELTYLRFATLPGSSTFAATLDSRVTPSWQQGEGATTWLVVEGERVASVRYETVLWI